MHWSNEERQGFLRGLDAVERVVVIVYRVLMVMIITAVIAAVVFVIVKRPWGTGTQGEWFYFSVIVLMVLGWAAEQFISAGRRLSRGRSRATFDSSHQSSTWTWQFRFGPAAVDSHQNLKAGDDDTQCGL